MNVIAIRKSAVLVPCFVLNELRSRRKKNDGRLFLEKLEHRLVLAAAVTGGLFPDGVNVLQGWAFAEAGSNANSSYAASVDDSDSGDTYSVLRERTR